MAKKNSLLRNYSVTVILQNFIFRCRRIVGFDRGRLHQVKPYQTLLQLGVLPHTHSLKHTQTMHLCRIVLKRADSRVKELDICFPNHLGHLLSVCAEREVSPSATMAPFTHHPYLSKRVSLQLPETTSSLFHPS